METVRVDLRKLQVLNDRINQTIDALTQLRQSVHGFSPTVGSAGLSHSSGMGYANPYAAAYGIGSAIPQGIPSAAIGSMLGNPTAAQGFGTTPWGWSPVGLSHSSIQGIPSFGGISQLGGIEMNPWTRFVDQASAYRIAQSFPYAFAQMPVVAL